MSIKIKNKDPKSTDFAFNEIVINRKDGTLFFKSEKNLLRIQGDTVSTIETEITPNNDIFVNNITASGNISASLTGSFGRIECLTISSSTGDFDASTIRIGGEPLNRSNLVALKEGRSIQSVARDLGEGDTNKTNIARVEAVMSVDDNSTYTKMTGTGRMGTFISGTLFHDLQKSPTVNLARIGDGSTDLLFSGSIVSASINGGSF